MKININIFTKSLLTLILCTLCSTEIALAQNSQEGFEIEEIVVTARKREESLQDSPVSVTAMTARDLEFSQIDGTQQLGKVVPNLTFEANAASSGSSSASAVFIRGVGQADFIPTTDPGVGVYIDGVYMARNFTGAMDFLNVDRVEVLRGPQGTTFGRNTIGGAISIHSRKPSDELQGKIRTKIGSDERREVAFSVDVPVSEQLKTQLNGVYRRRDGYVTNVINGRKTGDDDSRSIRAAMTWTPTEALEISFLGDYTKEKENGAPSVLVAFVDTATFPAIANGAAPGCPVVFPPGPPQPSPIGNLNCANSQFVLPPHEVAAGQHLRSDNEFYGGSVEINWKLDWFDFKSITAYREIESFTSRDADETPLAIFHTQEVLKQNQFSQEIQISGSSFNDSLVWMVGLYHFSEDATEDNPVQISIGSLFSGTYVDNTDNAAFTQVTYNITDKLNVTGGLRYSNEDKDFMPDQFFTTPFFTPVGIIPSGVRLLPLVTSTESTVEWTPMANISYHWSDSLMTYATWSEGFKSGGFVQRLVVPQAIPDRFDPEFVTSYEAGFKWGGGNFTLNGAAFFTDYDNIHIVVRRGIAPVTVNAGTAEVKGFELEGKWVPTPQVFLNFGLGLTDAEYTSLTAEAIATAGITTDSKFAFTPKWNANVGASFKHNISNWGSITARLDASYTDDDFRTANNAPHLFQSDYIVLNTALIFETSDEKWQLVLAGSNMTDKIYLQNGSDAASTAQGLAEGTFARGREWSLSLEYNYF